MINERGDHVNRFGKVVDINRSEKKGIVKKPIEKGIFVKDYGLEGDAHVGKWHRQISLLGIESFKKMKDLGVDGLNHGDFAENITTEGLILYELLVGTRLRIGETIQEVTQIGKECHTGCAIAQKVGKCIMPKEGIFTKVIKGGIVKPGDTIEVL
ncbi:MOSC domain-containing protein [Schnuerera sp. xch1]|uniref:MOSC domain-containing protein n=1 Tax=Schnuerera sp. xch1 TaxID=2874283 RepID=UPI0039896919|nr:MOSC domain-containing protein [Schnuerera sp. xch1]